MKAFVTGGSGFVGRNLIRQLERRGDEVRALVRSGDSARIVEALGAVPVMGGLDDVPAMQQGMSGCDAVFHSAAEVSEWAPRGRFWQVNVEGTRNTLDAAKAAGVPCFVHVGTEAALCDGSPLVDVDESRPLPARPLPRYPHTKAEAEKRVRAANAPGFRTVVVRPRLIWGNDDTSVLAALVAAVKAGRFLWMDGGRYPTSTCHVDNVCEGLLLAAERGRGGEAYFVTDGAPVELREFVTAMFRTQGVDPGDRSLPHAAALAFATASEWLWDTFRLRGAPPATRMAIRLFGEPVTVRDDKARRELGYAGRVTREQGLAGLGRVPAQ
ncbi:MAG TPA: NAD-dependent epimerase/dehydratase family protein [Candidatus Binatia bacterium]|nr:NAD-dependent epimerase/dehydratase family protein [Candidatus Binatia bacterium]